MKIRYPITHVAAALFVLLFGRPASALDFEIHPLSVSKTLNAILATGEIQLGDAEKLERFLAKLLPRKNIAVYLASTGGSLSEGIKLGLYFRERRIKTVVEGGNVCASACALAFLGGTSYNGHPWRSSSTTSKLGFHAFRSNSSNALNMDETQSVVAEVLRYGKAVDAPIELLIANFATSSSDIYWVSDQEICSLGIRLWSVEQSRFICEH